MSSLDFDLDSQMNNLEAEWRQVYEAGIVARADYQALASDTAANARLLEKARERLERSEVMKARIMAKIERLEATMLGED
jgi:hypothetical protein